MRLKKFLMTACLAALPVLGASIAQAQGTLRIAMTSANGRHPRSCWGPLSTAAA